MGELNGLSSSARDALLEVAKLLSGRFTGKIEMECNQGGVGNIRTTENKVFGEKAKTRKG